MFVPDKGIISSRPSSSSEARGAPESHPARTEKETMAESELEEGEIQSEDEEDNNLKKTLNEPPHHLNDDDDDDDLKNTAGSECHLPRPSSDNIDEDVEGHLGDLESPAVQNAVRLSSCHDDVTKQKSDSLEADVAPLPPPDGGI